jgi:adenosylhomocysteine nucleosidase
MSKDQDPVFVGVWSPGAALTDGPGAKIAIVAALEREVRPLVNGWRVRRQESAGRQFTFFEMDRTVVVCGGMGAECARRATQAVIELYRPEQLISAGYAGALEPGLRVGQVLTPRTVIDASDGSRTDTGVGEGALVSFASVADRGQKAKLRAAYGAQAVDMEAAAVARGAQAHGLRFLACKAISDASDFSWPAVGRFVGPNGQFRTSGFAFYLALRPWLWGRVLELARDSRQASARLCRSLAVLGATPLKQSESIFRASAAVKP